MQLIKYLLLTLLLGLSAAAFSNQQSDIRYVALDSLINDFKSTRENSVEMAMFRKLRFDGVIKEMPFPRQHDYLTQTIARFAPESNVVATLGLTIHSESEQELVLYMIDELKAGMEQHLKVGDKVKFEAYHAYNSDFGPGLVVYSWEKVTEPSALATWFDGLFN